MICCLMLMPTATEKVGPGSLGMTGESKAV